MSQTDEKISVAQFDLYIAYKSTPNGLEVFHGIPDGIDEATGKGRIIAPSVRIPGGDRVSDDILVTLFGFADSVAEASAQNAHFTKIDPKITYHPVSLLYEAGVVNPGVVHMDGLDKARFLSVRRISAEVQRLIQSYFAKFIEEAGGDPAAVAKVRQIANFPTLYSRLLYEAPEFSTVETLVAPISIGDGKYRQFGFVTKRAKLHAIKQNNGALAVAVLPPAFAG